MNERATLFMKWSLLIGFVAGFFALIAFIANNSDGNCYRELKAYNSWPTVNVVLQEAIKDNYVTVGECKAMQNKYVNAQRAQTIQEILNGTD